MNRKLKIAEIVLAVGGATMFAAAWLMSYWMWKAMPKNREECHDN